MSDVDPGNFEAGVKLSTRGSACCVRCRRLSSDSVLVDHYERAHRRHTITMEPGELDAVVELIRSNLVTDRVTSGGSVFAGPRSERERLLWNFFVRHDKRLRKLWTFLNSSEGENEDDEEPEDEGDRAP